jgi:hypothetical protein
MGPGPADYGAYARVPMGGDAGLVGPAGMAALVAQPGGDRELLSETIKARARRPGDVLRQGGIRTRGTGPAAPAPSAAPAWP